MIKGNALIGQSGGPTSVINASLAGVITAAKDFSSVDRIYGMRYGIEGFMKDMVVDLGAQPEETISGLRTTPSSALGSCRYKLKDPDLPLVLENFRKFNIRYVFLIGGNDTMDTICRLEEFASQNDYELVGIGIPKTVDNDLYGTDHTPGFPSAARYIALSVMQAGVLARDMQKVDQFAVFQCIGRSAGWLVGAAAAGKKDPCDAPHILCMPERSFDTDKFLSDVERCHREYGFVSVVCGEGITFAAGTPVSASRTRDKFNNVEFGAMGGTSAALALHRMISDKFGFRGEFQITESLPMCAADRAVKLDIEEAFMCGMQAVELAWQGKTGLMVSLERNKGKRYKCGTGVTPLHDVAVRARPVPDEFINEEGNFVSDAFMDYLRPLVGAMPEYVKLDFDRK